MLNERNNFVYENHFGRRFVGLENGVYLNHSDILDYSWSYDLTNNRISRFYRSTTKRKLPLVVIGKTEAEATAALNRLLEVVEADIQNMLPGKIYVGEYYLSGFVTASKKSQYLFSKRYCNLDLEFTTESSFWYRENKYSLTPGSATIISGMDYPYDYPFDYSASKAGQTVMCDSVQSNAFKLHIFGTAENPTVTIGGHDYSIDGTISAGESLLIDSLTKTITLTKADGTKENWFDKRNRDSYIFQEIPPGQNTVVWNDYFGFDLTIIEKRSEPKWI